MSGPQVPTILYNYELMHYEYWNGGKRRAHNDDVMWLINNYPEAEIDDTATIQHAYELGLD